MSGVFGEISLVIVLAGVLGLVLHLLKQPAIVGYVITGLIIGPVGYLHLNNTEVLNSLSEIGITLLLFMVGLELSLKDVKHLGWSVLFIGLGQIVIMTFLGSVVFTMFNIPLRAAMYLSLGVGVSSTIVAVKILSEKKDLESLYGKLVLGILIVEDIVSILALALITGFGTETVPAASALFLVLAKLIVLFALAIAASRHLFPWLVEKLAKSSELIFLFALAWGLGFATFVSHELFGLTPEIGGFLAGLTLANSPANLHIASRMKPLRDFFLILFFIVLGSQIVLNHLSSMLLAAAGIAVLGVIIKPVFTFILLSVLGYRGRTSFLTSSSLAHISEFSIILAVLGWRAGHLSEELLSTMTLATIFSFIFASYILTHNQSLAKTFRKFLSWWDPEDGIRESGFGRNKLKNHFILVGAHRTGHSILHSLEDLHKNFVVIDFNPTIVRNLKNKGIHTIFGDISDPDVFDYANIDKAKLIICTVPDYEDNLSLLETAKARDIKSKLVLSANNEWEAQKLYEKGADYVLMPHFLGGLHLAELLRKDGELKGLSKLRKRDLELIEEIV